MWGKILIAAGILCFFIVATSMVERDISCDVGFYGDWHCDKFRGFPFTQSSTSFLGAFYHGWHPLPHIYNFVFWSVVSALIVVAGSYLKQRHDEIMARP